jgi:hypothetical protein
VHWGTVTIAIDRFSCHIEVGIEMMGASFGHDAEFGFTLLAHLTHDLIE